MDTVFEIIMLVCFGAAWPISIVKAVRSKSTKGKSLLFIIVIMVGYVGGILHKITNDPNYVMYLYMLNLTMVIVDLILYLRNRKKEKAAEADTQAAR